MYERLFEPITLGGVTVKNRVVLPAHGPRLPQARYDRYLEERMAGGVGLMVISGIELLGFTVVPPGPAGVTELDMGNPDPSTPEGRLALDEVLLPEMRRHAEIAHRHGGLCFRQLVHTGSYSTRADHRPGISPSGVPDEMLGETPHALSIPEIHRLVDSFIWAGERAQRGGLDGVEVHACHGLLLNAFLSPITNRRDDEYGGSTENRTRIVREILTGIRAKVGDGFPIGLRIPGDEYLEGGADAEEMASIGKLLSPLLDYISIAGSSESGRKSGVTVPAVPSAAFPEAVHKTGAGIIRRATGLPVIVTGRVVHPDTAEQVLADGEADMVGMVRALMADPLWLSKLQEGEAEDIRLCTGDNEGCRQRTLMRARGGGMSIACTVNASVGREAEYDRPLGPSRRVAIVGGGPAGMEAARVASLRGHQVTLFERSAELGGQVRIAVRDPRGKHLESSIRYLERQVRRHGVEIRLETEASAELLREWDSVIVATGAAATQAAFPVDGVPTVTAWEVLRGEVEPGEVVCIVAGIDGHRAPATLAELLVEQGHRVHLLTERMFVGEALDPGSAHNLLKRLQLAGVEMHSLTTVAGVAGRTVQTRDSLTHAAGAIGPVDTVVTMARASEDTLLRSLQGEGMDRVIGIGDCIAPRRILQAVLEGSRAAVAL